MRFRNAVLRSLYTELNAEGLFSPTWDSELAYLCESIVMPYMRRHGGMDVLELGTAEGLSAIMMAAAIRCSGCEGRVVTVDDGSECNVADTQANIDKWGQATVDFIPSDDLDYLKNCQHNYGVIFVDSWHVYKRVASVIPLAWDLVRIPGVLCGHDFGPTWIGVAKAVREWWESEPYDLWSYGVYERIWWTVKK